MNFSSSLKKIACLMLALLMILTAFGCTETKKKKKKVIVEEVVIVKPSDDDDDYNNETPSDTDEPQDEPQDEPEEEEKGLPERPLPDAAEVEGGYVEWKEPIIPEFEYEYAELSITDDYVIDYAFEEWENRKESATLLGTNADGTPIL